MDKKVIRWMFLARADVCSYKKKRGQVTGITVHDDYQRNENMMIKLVACRVAPPRMLSNTAADDLEDLEVHICVSEKKTAEEKAR